MHRGKQRSDVGRQITQFGRGLSTFSRRLENDVAELKRSVASKPHSGRTLATGVHLRDLECKVMSIFCRRISAVAAWCRCTDATMLAKYAPKGKHHC